MSVNPQQVKIEITKKEDIGIFLHLSLKILMTILFIFSFDLYVTIYS